MDRIRNARHFAPRLQRWLDDLATAARPAASQADEGQLDLFGESTPGQVASRPAANAPATHPPAVPAPSTWQAPRPATPASSEPSPPSAASPSASSAPSAPPASHATSRSPDTAQPLAPPTAAHGSAMPQAGRGAAPDGPHPSAPAGQPGAAGGGNAPGAHLLRPPPVPLRAPEPPKAPPHDGLPRRQLMVAGYVLEYSLRRSSRHSIGFMIDDDGLRVTAPKRVSIAEIDNAIRAKQSWILGKLEERRQRRAARLQKPPIDWVDGTSLPYLGGELKLRLYTATRNRTDYNPDTRELHMGLIQGATETLLKERVKSWMQQQAKVLFEQRLDLYAARLGVEYRAFALSSAGTRWGSCTVQRVIRLNWKLIHFSLPLIDYVAAHELAHILEMNHSPRFWAQVGRIYPAYDEAKALLRRRAQELPVLFN